MNIAGILQSLGLSDGLSWDSDGNIYGRETLATEQNAALDAALAAYDPMAEVKDAARARIDADCTRRRAAGVLVQFPDKPGIVQTRGEIDLINVSGVASAGLAATVAGTMPPLYFRDAANDNHELTPTQAVDFGAQVMQRLQAITKAAHDAKDAINRPEVDTLEHISAIEAGVVWP